MDGAQVEKCWGEVRLRSSLERGLLLFSLGFRAGRVLYKLGFSFLLPSCVTGSTSLLVLLTDVSSFYWLAVNSPLPARPLRSDFEVINNWWSPNRFYFIFLNFYRYF